MKKLTSLPAMILAAALLCGAVTASAASKKPSSTTASSFFTTAGETFSEYMEGEGYKFDYVKSSSNSGSQKEDHFTIGFNCDNVPKGVDFDVFFDSDNEGAVFYIWDYVKFKPDRLDEMIDLCNEMNLKYRFCKFYVEDDNTVTVQSDAIFYGHDIGEICECFILTTTSIADKAYPAFEEALS